MVETGIETNSLLTQLLEKSSRGRKEQGKIKKTIMELMSKFENIETRTKKLKKDWTQLKRIQS